MDSGFLKLYSRFQCPGFRIPDSGFRIPQDSQLSGSAKLAVETSAKAVQAFTYTYIPQFIGQLHIIHYKRHKRIGKRLPETVQGKNKITSDWLENRDL